MHLPISGWVIYECTCPHLADCSVVYDPILAWLPCPTLPIHLILPQTTFCLFVSLDEKVLKGKCFANVEELKQKTAEALKGIKIDEFKNCFEQWKKHLDNCIASNGEYFEGDSFKHVRISIHFFISNFWYFWNPPLYIKTLCWALILQSY